MNLDRPQTYDILSYLILLPRESVSSLSLLPPSFLCELHPMSTPALVNKPVSEVHIWPFPEAALSDNPPFQ